MLLFQIFTLWENILSFCREILKSGFPETEIEQPFTYNVIVLWNPVAIILDCILKSGNFAIFQVFIISANFLFLIPDIEKNIRRKCDINFESKW